MLRAGVLLATAIACALAGGCGPTEGRASTAAAQQAVCFAGVLDALRAEQFSVKVLDEGATRDAELSQLGKRATAGHTLVLNVDEALDVVIAERVERDNAAAALEAPPVFLKMGVVDIVPINGDARVWQRLVSAMHSHGAGYVETRTNLVGVLASLQTLRLQVEIYEAGWRQWQPTEASQWGDLFEPEALLLRSRNPLAEHDVRSRLAVIAKPGATGAEVSLKSAGWVWNSADRVLYPAGASEDQIESAVSTMDEWSPFMDRRRREVKSILGGYRAAIAGVGAESRAAGHVRNPTLEEMTSGVFRSPPKQSMANPFNGSAVIQIAEWNFDAQPVKGEAGWNYDPRTGKFWANSDVTGENEF